MLSDYDDPVMISNLRSNISVLPSSLQPRVHTMSHSWGTPVDSLTSFVPSSPVPLSLTPNLSHRISSYDLILLADTLWSSSSHDPLLASLVLLLERTERAFIQIVAGFHTGRESVWAFLRKAGEVGFVKEGKWEEVGWEGERREWRDESGEEEEEIGERNRWVVEGRLRWSKEELERSA